MSKLIKLINSNRGIFKLHETEAQTWGELKLEINSNSNLSSLIEGDVKGVVKETTNTLELDSSQLPDEKLSSEDAEEDFAIFFLTKKSKAGADRYDNMSFRELRSECSSRPNIEGNSGNYGSAIEMRAVLRADDENNTPNDCNVSTAFQEEVIDRLESIESKVEDLLSGSSHTETRNTITEEESNMGAFLQDELG